MGGAMAREFHDFLAVLWSGRAKFVIPRDFKWILSRFATQFSGAAALLRCHRWLMSVCAGYQQQDAHELLMFVLDALHEDTNGIVDKPYTQAVEATGMDPVEAAAEAWRRHGLRNKSRIVDLFALQLRSTLECRMCHKESVVFDPSTTLELPVPVDADRAIRVTVLRLDGRLPVRYLVRVPRAGCVGDLCSAVEPLCRVPAERLVMIEVYEHRFARVLADAVPMRAVRFSDDVFACVDRWSGFVEIED
jgi:ubiquitin carboxyl-terminal hydrolase 4/11/15